MGAWFRSWWQKNKRLLITVTAIVILVVFALAVYRFGWDWTGFNGGYSKITTGTTTIVEQPPAKTLWDWLQLLFIPTVLTLGAVWITARQNHDHEIAREQHENDLRIAEDSQCEVALQSYIDKISELLLHEKLRDSPEEDEVRNIARVRTLTVLHKLDPLPKRTVIRFLQESALIDKNNTIIDLSFANLRNADLHRAHLHVVDLHEVDLRKADLREANLSGADLRGARLNGANLANSTLSEASLEGADLSSIDTLSGTNLSGAKVTDEQLAKAKSLTGATMPDGSIHA